jgi:hypothetical protein
MAVLPGLVLVTTYFMVLAIGVEPPRVDHRDREVLEVALKDILNPKNQVYEKDEQHYGPWPRTIVLHRMTYADLSDVDEPDVKKFVSGDLIAGWRRRNSGDEMPVSRLGLSDKALIIADLDKISDEADRKNKFFGELFRERYPDSGGYAITSLSGYSRGGTAALVVFHLGPSPHGVTWVSLLTEFEGRWKVGWRKRHIFE